MQKWMKFELDYETNAIFEGLIKTFQKMFNIYGTTPLCTVNQEEFLQLHCLTSQIHYTHKGVYQIPINTYGYLMEFLNAAMESNDYDPLSEAGNAIIEKMENVLIAIKNAEEIEC